MRELRMAQDIESCPVRERVLGFHVLSIVALPTYSSCFAPSEGFVIVATSRLRQVRPFSTLATDT